MHEKLPRVNYLWSGIMKKFWPACDTYVIHCEREQWRRRKMELSHVPGTRPNL